MFPSTPHIKHFLRGANLINPPVVHRFPARDLPKVLTAVTQSPFEPRATIDLRELTLKTLLLIAVTSARRVSELGVLSVNPNLCIFHRDKVELCPGPSFLMKVNAPFHQDQVLVLPSFCPNHPKEKRWPTLDCQACTRFLYGAYEEHKKI